MKRIFTAIVFVAAMASCKKDKLSDSIAEPKPEIDKISDNQDEEEELDLKVLNLDLSTVSFTPSTSPLYLSSVAVGKKTSDSSYNKAPLTYSGWTHPAVLKFHQKWNNHTYWAAITPYPNIDSQYENPHIFCSDNGINWIEPPGIINPIEPVPAIIGYNSDVNLMMDSNYLYCYWREVSATRRTIWVKKSQDGVHWSAREYVCHVPVDYTDIISPAIVKDGNLYDCYAVCTGEKAPGSYYDNISIRRMVSSDPITGFNPDINSSYELVNIQNRPWGSTQDPWHLEVKKVCNIWLMLVTTTNHNGYGSGGKLYMGYSTDGKNFNFINSPICNANGSTYKSSFHPVLSKKGNCINIELWRSMTSFGWAIFYDKFSIKMSYAPAA